MGDSLKNLLLRALSIVALLLVLTEAATAATLYISEFPNGVSQNGTTTAQISPQAAITDQTVAISGASAASAAFNSATHAVMLVCDTGCSVDFGSAPTATTSNYLLQQGVPYRFGVSSGSKVAVIANSAGNVAGSASTTPVNVVTSDPCASAAKSSAAINVTSATTTSLVAVSGATKVYVCGFSMTIAPSATSADTAAFEYGTGASCTSPILLTGTFGNGDLTSAAAVVPVTYGGGNQTIFTGAASSGICILTTGTAVSVQGVLTYVQQ